MSGETWNEITYKAAEATIASASGGAGPTASQLPASLGPKTGAESLSVVSATATTLTASQVTVPATANGILVLAANANRQGATINNTGAASIFIQQGATGVTTSNGFEIKSGTAFNIDSPLYTGAIYGICAAGTNVVSVLELT